MSKRLTSFLGKAAIVATLICLSGAAAGADSCAVPDPDIPSITTCFFDLTASPSTTPTPTPAPVLLNGGLFRVPPTPEGDLGIGTIVGTGLFQPFVRIQEPNGNNNGIQAGFNTNGRDGVGPAAMELDNHDKGGSNWNHAIRLSDIPIVTVCDGGTSTGTNCKQYYEFLLDVNEQGNSPNSGISLDEFKLFTAGLPDITGFTGDDDKAGITDFSLDGAALKYDMDGPDGGDASILMDYMNFSGSGNGVDLQALVAVENLAGVSGDDYVYLYSKFGWTGGQCQVPGGTLSPCAAPNETTIGGTAGELNFAADAGFEEWSIRKKVPLPSTLLLLGIGFAGLVSLRRLRRKPQV